jgi:hypothetical protein
MAPSQPPQTATPVSRIGPVTILGAVVLGLRTLRFAATASKAALEMIAGTSVATCSLTGFCLRVRESRLLKTESPI